jgi:hypothetical protein
LTFGGAAAPTIAVQCPDDVPVADVVADLILRFQFATDVYHLQLVEKGDAVDLDPQQTLFQQGVAAGALLNLVSGPASPKKGTRAAANYQYAKAMIGGDAPAVATETPNVEQFRQLIGDLQRKVAFLQQTVDPTEPAVSNAFVELNETLSDAAEETAATSGGSGGGRTTGGSDVAGDDGGERGRERGGKRRRRPQKQQAEALDDELVSELRQFLASAGRADTGRGVHITYPEVVLHYVLVETLRNFDENTSDVQKWRFMAGIWVGAAVTIAGNWLTAGSAEVSLVSLLAMVMFLCNGGLSFFWAAQSQRRANACRDRMKVSAKPQTKSRTGKSKKSRPAKPPEDSV